MKKLLIPLFSFVAMIAMAGNWTNYPTVTTPGLTDTFLIGTTTTNQQISAQSISNWIGTTFIKNLNPTDTNLFITAVGGGNLILSNALTSSTLILPPSGPVTASGGFDIGTNTGNIIINGNVTVSNTIIIGAFYTLTNSAPTHIVPMGESDYATNGAIVFTGLANVNMGTYNYGVIHLLNTSGSVNPITPPASWGPGTNGTWLITNQTVLSVYVGPGTNGVMHTNAICYPVY